MNAYLAGLLLVGSCVTQGMQVDYRMARGRTSNVIRDAQARVTVVSTDDEETSFKVDAEVKPIIGAAREFSIERAFPTEAIDVALVARLRDEGPYQTDEFRASYISQEGPCDWVLIDEIPDSDELQDVVVRAKVCGDGIPMLNMDFKSQGRSLRLGLDRR